MLVGEHLPTKTYCGSVKYSIDIENIGVGFFLEMQGLKYVFKVYLFVELK